MTAFIEREINRLSDNYQFRTPLSRKQFEIARKSLPGGNTRNNLYFAPYPPYFERGEGSKLTDIDGNNYIDFLSDFTVAICGHSNPTLIEEAQKTLSQGMSYGGCTAAESRLAEAIKDRFNSIEQLRFANSGTEANLYALLTALAYSKKNKVIVFEGNYHGGMLNFCHPNIPINAPFDTIILPYNDPAAFETALLEHGDQVGAVMIELMMNSGGCIPADQEFVDTVRKQTLAHDIPLIVDEVMTARLNYHGLQEKYQITPDLTSLGKIIGGGFTIGAFGGKEKYMRLYDTQKSGFTAHGGSFNNNVLSMNVGAASLSNVLTKDVMVMLNEQGDNLREQLNKIFYDAEVPLVFTGGGSVMNLHLAKATPISKNTNPLSAEICKLYHRFLLNEGIWIAPRGLIALSIETTDKGIHILIEKTNDFISQYRADLKGLA